ncbi:hypothetical protein K501DRAFT_333639 [Backusella circina FSU 941]|nr:hypothetical protein K501DRAFT_333639 [Backusella circina FSU 941]
MFEELSTRAVAPCLFLDDWSIDKEFMFKPVISEEKHSKNFQQNTTTSLDREKVLEKNRQAAFRCRQKKKKWTQNLEERVEEAEERNKELVKTVADLREEALYLRNLLLMHCNCDCTVVQSYMRRASEKLAKGMTTTAGSAFIKVHPNSRTYSYSYSCSYPYSPY